MNQIKNPQAAAAALALIKAILFYGCVVFAAGFVFGVLRELVLIPMTGRLAGRWIEFLVLLVAVAWIARMAVQRLHDRRRKYLLALGIIGTLIMLAMESLFVLYVMRLPWEKYMASFDVTAGELFVFGLLFMCAAPAAMHYAGMKRQ